MQPISGVPGLYIQLEIMDGARESQILTYINNQPWDNTLSRATQHYIRRYNYSGGDLTPAQPLSGPILEVAQWLQSCGIITPQQAIVNEYRIDDGIAAHTDRNNFGPRIVSISLGAPTNMIFRRRSEPFNKIELELPRRSILIMEGEARYNWTHEIPKRRTVNLASPGSLIAGPDKINKDANYQRVSLTFRTIS